MGNKQHLEKKELIEEVCTEKKEIDLSCVETKRENNSKRKSERIEESEDSSLSGKDTDDGDGDVNEQQLLLQKEFPLMLVWFDDKEKHICVTGSFCQWKKQSELNYNENKKRYEIVINLPKGMYQFKFVVNSVWQYSKKYPITLDNNNNINNYIYHDNCNNNIKDEKELLLSDIFSNSFESSNESLINETCASFGNYFPKRSEMSSKCKRIPFEFKKTFDLIQFNRINQRKGRKHFLSKLEKNILSENNSYKQLQNKTHILNNHLFTNSKVNKTYMCVSLNMRVRNKITTFVFCSPLKN